MHLLHQPRQSSPTSPDACPPTSAPLRSPSAPRSTQVPPSEALYKEQPLGYLSHMLGHEGGYGARERGCDRKANDGQRCQVLPNLVSIVPVQHMNSAVLPPPNTLQARAAFLR